MNIPTAFANSSAPTSLQIGQKQFLKQQYTELRAVSFIMCKILRTNECTDSMSVLETDRGNKIMYKQII